MIDKNKTFNKHKKVIFYIVISIVLSLSFACTVEDGYVDSEDTEGIIDQDDGSIIDAVDDKAGLLAGSCPRGNQCTSPGCPQWSDIDQDGVCDRA